MANTKQAKKRVIQAEKRRQHNASLRSKLRTSVKKVLVSITTGDQAQSNSLMQEATSVIDRMAHKGIIHPNKAARHKSRIAKKIKKLGSDKEAA